MNTKLALKIGIPGAAVSAVSVGLAVPIATKDHKQAWKVNLTNSGMYGTDVYDAAQSKSKSSTDAEKAFVWGILNDKDQKTAVATKWGIASNDVLPLLKDDNDKNYQNGLQKLAHEMMHPSQDNGVEATLVYGDGTATVLKAGLSEADTVTKITTLLTKKDSSGLVETFIYDVATHAVVAVDATVIAAQVHAAAALPA